MQSLALSLVLIGAALAQGPHPQGVKHIVLDMNVEVVSLLGEKLYRTPAEGEELKKLEATLAEAEKHVAAQPENPAVYVELGQALEALWRCHDAAQAYTKAISLAPDDAAHFARRGNVFIVLRQFQQASNDFQHAIAIAPDGFEGWRGFGLASYMQQKFKEAHEAFVKAITLAPAGSTQAGPEIAMWDFLLAQRVTPEIAPVSHGGAYFQTAEMTAYFDGWNELQGGDSAAAVQKWRALVDSTSNWPSLAVIAAEAEIAAIEGSKKMKSLNEE